MAIALRERELAAAAGREASARPRYADEPTNAPQVIKVVRKPGDQDG